MSEVSPFEWMNILFRWFHTAAAILWVGLLYFFNFVNGPFTKSLDDETRRKVMPLLMPRALFFFRWAAMVTFVLGWMLFYLNYLAPNAPSQVASGRGHWIMLGMTLATVMWFNVWFIIWPAQRRILRGIKNGDTALPALAARVHITSLLNVYLSFPVVFSMMAGAGHFPYSDWPVMVGVFLVGGVASRHLLKAADKIGTDR